GRGGGWMGGRVANGTAGKRDSLLAGRLRIVGPTALIERHMLLAIIFPRRLFFAVNRDVLAFRCERAIVSQKHLIGGLSAARFQGRRRFAASRRSRSSTKSQNSELSSCEGNLDAK